MPAAIAIPAIMGAVTAGSSIASGVMGSNAAKKAANTQAGAAEYAADKQYQAAEDSLNFQKDVFNTDQTNLAPYLATGKVALGELGTGTAPGGEFNSTPTGDQILAEDPGYQFRLNQGQLALERAEAAGGGVGSGGALKAATQYGQDYASGEYSNAFNRFMANRQANFAHLASLAGLGSTATGPAASAGSAAASNVGNINTTNSNIEGQDLMAAGNATASGYMGSANASAGMLSSLANIGTSLIGRLPLNSNTNPVSTNSGANLPIALGPMPALNLSNLGTLDLSGDFGTALG